MSRKAKSPETIPAADVPEKPQDNSKRSDAVLSVPDAWGAVEAAQKARDEAHAAVDELIARIDDGDDTIPMGAIRAAREAAEYNDHRLAGAQSNLKKALVKDGQEKSDRLQHDVEVLTAKRSRLHEAHQTVKGAIGELISANSDYLVAHEELARRAGALPGAAADPDRRNLPDHESRFWGGIYFAPKVEGVTFAGNWFPEPAVMAAAVVAVAEKLGPSKLDPKWQDEFRAMIPVEWVNEANKAFGGLDHEAARFVASRVTDNVVSVPANPQPPSRNPAMIEMDA
jgi:hypothetical protein